MWFNPSSMLVRRDALLQCAGCDERVFTQDYALALRLALGFRFGISESSVAAAPDFGVIATDRLSSNKAQLLHDHNLSLLLFLEDRPDLSKRYRRQAWRRMAGRSWKWARREAGRPLWSRELALCLRALLPWAAHEPCWALLETFTATGRVRRRPAAELRRAGNIKRGSIPAANTWP